VMPRGETNVFQIVVFSARAQTALRTRRTHIRPFVFSDEHIFELHHAGVREVERWIVRRDEQGRRIDARMALRFEERQKLFPDFCEFHGVFKFLRSAFCAQSRRALSSLRSHSFWVRRGRRPEFKR
jgi:hypothetical protein